MLFIQCCGVVCFEDLKICFYEELLLGYVGSGKVRIVMF